MSKFSETEANALLNSGPLLILGNVAVIGSIEDGEAMIVLAFHNDGQGSSLNFALDIDTAEGMAVSVLEGVAKARIEMEKLGKPRPPLN